MPPIIQVEKVFAGVYPAMVLVHLSDILPAPPYTIGGFTESSWSGYRAAGLSLIGRVPTASGFSFVLAAVAFQNYTQSPVSPASLWADAMIGGVRQLLGVLPLPSGDKQQIPPGGVSWILGFQAFDGS